jgi:hypothetical protein
MIEMISYVDTVILILYHDIIPYHIIAEARTQVSLIIDNLMMITLFSLLSCLRLHSRQMNIIKIYYCAMILLNTVPGYVPGYDT